MENIRKSAFKALIVLVLSISFLAKVASSYTNKVDVKNKAIVYNASNSAVKRNIALIVSGLVVVVVSNDIDGVMIDCSRLFCLRVEAGNLITRIEDDIENLKKITKKTTLIIMCILQQDKNFKSL